MQKFQQKFAVAFKVGLKREIRKKQFDEIREDARRDKAFLVGKFAKENHAALHTDGHCADDCEVKKLAADVAGPMLDTQTHDHGHDHGHAHG